MPIHNPVQIATWKASMVQGLMSGPSKADREQNQKQVRTIQSLEKDLARKEKALAEVVALLVCETASNFDPNRR